MAANDRMQIQWPMNIVSPWDDAMRRFSTREELTGWAANEARRWGQAFSRNTLDNPFYRKLEKHLRKVPEKLSEAVRNADADGYVSERDYHNFTRMLDYYNTGAALTTDGAVGAQTLRLLNDNKAEDALALALAATEILDRPNFIDEAEVATEIFLSLKRKGKILLTEFQPKDQKFDWQDFINKRVAEVEALERRNQKVALDVEAEKSRLSWAERAKINGYLALGFAIAWLGSIGIGTALFFTYAYTNYVDIAAEAGVSMFKFVPSLAASLFVAIFGIWVLRTLLRLFYASRELREDALERIVMLETLISLIDNKAVTPELRPTLWKQAFDAIFRPGGQKLDVDSPLEALSAIGKAADVVKQGK